MDNGVIHKIYDPFDIKTLFPVDTGDYGAEKMTQVHTDNLRTENEDPCK